MKKYRATYQGDTLTVALKNKTLTWRATAFDSKRKIPSARNKTVLLNPSEISAVKSALLNQRKNFRAKSLFLAWRKEDCLGNPFLEVKVKGWYFGLSLKAGNRLLKALKSI